jgi:hypothetical protein
MPERERRHRIERFVPVVDALAADEEGRRDLAAICAAYLAEHRPVTEVSVPAPVLEAAARVGAAGAAEAATAVSARAAEGGRRRRRRPRRRSRP